MFLAFWAAPGGSWVAFGPILFLSTVLFRILCFLAAASSERRWLLHREQADAEKGTAPVESLPSSMSDRACAGAIASHR